MYLKKITGLAQFLSEGNKTSEQIAKFLVLKTFSELSPKSSYIAEISDDGYLSPVAGFGFDKQVEAQWGRVPLSMQLPITDSVRKDKCIVIRSVDEFCKSYPIARELESIDIDWQTYLTVPILPFGVGVITLQQQPDKSDDLIYFAEAVGALVSFHFTRRSHDGLTVSKSSKKKFVGESLNLSERQEVVHQLMMKGFTNAQIALELGYSESLIRQETIQIFRILGVSGRKEMLKEALRV